MSKTAMDLGEYHALNWEFPTSVGWERVLVRGARFTIPVDRQGRFRSMFVWTKGELVGPLDVALRGKLVCQLI
jgi:hypothetical protein